MFFQYFLQLVELLMLIFWNFKKLFAIAPPINIFGHDFTNDKRVSILVETLDPPIIAKFFPVDFLILLITLHFFIKINAGT